MQHICRFATIPNISSTNAEIHPPVTTLPIHAKRNVVNRVTPGSAVLEFNDASSYAGKNKFVFEPFLSSDIQDEWHIDGRTPVN